MEDHKGLYSWETLGVKDNLKQDGLIVILFGKESHKARNKELSLIQMQKMEYSSWVMMILQNNLEH